MATRYKILENSFTQGLTREINVHLDDGWRLAGPLVVDTGRFYQPVCKDVEDVKPVDSGSYDRAMKGL